MNRDEYGNSNRNTDDCQECAEGFPDDRANDECPYQGL